MNIKKIILISIIALIILSSFSVVSAGWFDFLNGEPALSETKLSCWDASSSDAGKMKVMIFLEGTNSNSLKSYQDIPVQVNITDENNNTTSFNITNWEIDYGNSGKLCYYVPLDFGTYNVSIYFQGNDEFNASYWNGAVVIAPDDDEQVDANTIERNDTYTVTGGGSHKVVENGEVKLDTSNGDYIRET